MLCIDYLNQLKANASAVDDDCSVRPVARRPWQHLDLMIIITQPLRERQDDVSLDGLGSVWQIGPLQIWRARRWAHHDGG